MALLYCSRVFFESSQCCFQASRPVYASLQMWPRALDERFKLPLPLSQIISWYTPRSPNSISPRDDDGTSSIRSKKCVVLVFKDPHGLIWPMTVTMQKWFMIFNLLIRDRQYLVVRRGTLMHRRNYDFTRLGSDFSKPSVLLYILLLWYIDET